MKQKEKAKQTNSEEAVKKVELAFDYLLGFMAYLDSKLCSEYP